MRHLLMMAVVVALAAPAGAQRPAPSPFASAKALKCTFTSVINAEWVDGEVNLTTIPNGFSFDIGNVDLRRGRARVLGANGASAEATLVLTGTSLNVMERTPIGNFNVTSIFAGGGSGGRFITVFSQHLGDPTAAPSAAQAYGACTIG
jgi:hypothetical protein